METNEHSSDWRLFHGGAYGRPGHTNMRVTVNSRNYLYFNEAAFEALGNPVAVEFYYSERLHAIGVKSAEAKVGSAFPCYPKKYGRGYYIRASAFLHHKKLIVEGTVQFNRISFDHQGMMMLPLHFVTRVGRGAR